VLKRGGKVLKMIDMKIVKWFTKLREIVRGHDAIVASLNKQIADLEAERRKQKVAITDLQSTFKNCTSLSFDLPVSSRDACQVILTGRFQDNDYVQLFSIHTETFGELVKTMQEWRKRGNVRYIDKPMSMARMFSRLWDD